MYETDMYEGMLAETVTIQGHAGDTINAYLARPLGAGPFPGVVLIHHVPGWDEWYREATRRFAHHGYAAISPNLYFREGHGTPDDVAAKVPVGQAESPTTRLSAMSRARCAMCGLSLTPMARSA